MATGGIAPGTVLGGRYRLDDLLSEDHGARFWRGVDRVLGRSVAVNVVPADDPRATALLAAARSSAQVVDAHLLRVLDCDQADGISWVVNEWGEGTSLDLLLQEGPLLPTRAAWLAREVARTLVSAHRAGVAHGRLTPEAVLLTEAGTVKLIGFVVSSAIEGQSAADARAARRGYAGIDPRQADVIDLAAVLYAALTGRWPGLSRSSVPDAPEDQRGPLRPRQVRAGVPSMLDALCERVLRREGHEHVLPIETAEEVLAALEDHLGEYADQAAVTAPIRAAGRSSAGPARPHRSAASAGWGTDPEATQAAAPPVWDDEDRPRPGSHPPPAPAFEDLAGRPLFAATDRRPAPPSAEPGSAAWLFGDDPSERTAPPGKQNAAGGRRPLRLVLGAVAIVLLLTAMVVAFLVGRDGSAGSSQAGDPPPSPTTNAPAPAWQPVSVRDFDPQGKGPKGRPAPEENPDEVPLATDGDPATGWHTLTYRSAALGGLKSGVGLLVDLGADREVGSVDLTLTGAPTGVELYASPAGVSDPPTGLGGLRKVGGLHADEPTATLRLSDRVRSRYLVVWLTELPRQGHGYRGQIDELAIRR